MVFYNWHGQPTAYTENDVDIYLFTGEPVAYLNGDAVYAFDGRHLGWFSKGWVRDLNGCCVFFTEDASGSGPAKPAKYACPAKYAKYAKPAKCAREARHARAVNSVGWSQLSGRQFFA